MKRFLYLAVFIVVALFALTLSLKNSQTIPIHYYFNVALKAPLFLVIMVPFFVGMLFGMLLMMMSVFRHKRRVGKTNKELKKVEKEVASLRAMPLKDET